MCGIAGIVDSSREVIETSRLAEMIGALDHRGPNDRGWHAAAGAGLAHSRLSIIDIAGGAQPMSTADGSLWITFNGEIFNYLELRDELVSHGHTFRTRSDTEVLLQLFQRYGAAAVEKLNGQWAMGVWNTQTRTLFLSRDRLGVRPLFYTVSGGRLLFASEIKALFTVPGVSRELDPQGLDNVFTFWTTLAPRTAFKGIYELPPGHSLTWCDGRLTISQHWRSGYAPDAAAMESETECAETLRTLLTDATRIRLRSDVPVGAYLSGGLDSSLIAALMRSVTDGPLRTFSISFDDPRFDESLHQRQMAKALRTDHREFRCSARDITRVFPDVVWHAETPLVRTAPAPLFLLSKLVRDEGFKVVMTGEGADEIFGGYDIFKEAKIRRFAAAFPQSARRASLVGRLYPYLADLHRQPAATLHSFFHAAPDDLVNPVFSHLPRWRLTSKLKLLFSDDVRSALEGYDGYADIASRLPAEHADWDPFAQGQYLETAHLLPGYILSSQGDRVAMAHGIEGRFPFLDANVVAFAAALPPALKMKVLNEKYLLKLSARDLVPPSVWQRSKQPYRAPGAETFFAGAPPAYVNDLLSEAQVRRDGIFNPTAVTRLVQKFRDGRTAGTKDDMALVGVLSTQILVDRYINNFSAVTYAPSRAGTA